MIKVQNRVTVYEINEKDTTTSELMVFSHWNDPNRIILQFDQDKRYTVLASDIIEAIKNAQNSNRFK